jgi:ABC-2 type transport system permease protein
MRLFWSFTRQSFHNSAIYRFDFWLQLFAVFLMMYSVFWIWNILYHQSPGAFGVSLDQMVTYGVLGMALDTIFHPGRGPQMYIAQQIRSGAIDTDLMKPLDFHVHMLARQFGETLFRFATLAVPSMIIGYLFLDLRLPAGWAQGLLFVLSILLGFTVLFSLNFLLGLLSVVTLDIRSITWAYNGLVRFFAGQMVPLWLFPGFIGALAAVLPFKSIFYIPLSIYIGRLSGSEAWQAVGFQLVWISILIPLGRLAWGRIHNRLVVQGG